MVVTVPTMTTGSSIGDGRDGEDNNDVVIIDGNGKDDKSDDRNNNKRDGDRPEDEQDKWTKGFSWHILPVTLSDQICRKRSHLGKQGGTGR